ncbi:MAG: hypothetical protein E6Q78_12400 [Rhodoferax sp.]|nr:MAG: hypothetical protein E6Q78_12400 [Rhodoferax sp.]
MQPFAEMDNFGAMKILLLVLASFIALIILGYQLPSLIPGCSCGYPGSGCHGCGELLGNALGNFAYGIYIWALMGMVLFMWFGIPLGIVGFILWGIYKIFTAKKES